MKKTAIIPDGMPSLDELNNLISDKSGTGSGSIHEKLRMKVSYRTLHNDELPSPDTYGAERFFINYFVNEEMEMDFPLIARDFFVHEFANIPSHEYSGYPDIDSGSSWPDSMFIQFVMTLMMNAVNAGSEYTEALLMHLHKVYYKKEYKSLKKFRSISLGELISLAESEDESSFHGNLSRIICMAKMYGITIKPECYAVYDMLNALSDDFFENEEYSFLEATGDHFQKSLAEIDEKYDANKMYSLNDRISKFVGNVFKWLGYCPNYADLCDENSWGMKHDLAVTLSILKRTYRGREYTEEELTAYAAIFHCASALTCNTDWMAETLKMIAYGEDDSSYFDDFPGKFNPQDVKLKSKPPVKPDIKRPINKTVPAVKEEQKHYNEAALLAEIDALRRKVHRLESDNSCLRGDLAEKRRQEEDARFVREQLEAAGRELAALRDYVYNLTEDDRPSQDVSVADMKEYISGLRIVIVGGHSNWVSKMRKEFPNWVFVKPDAGGSTDVSIVDKADHVYFFTDTISHAKYYQFLNVVRERKVAFGYIHGVNIEKNIRDIYRDCGET